MTIFCLTLKNDEDDDDNDVVIVVVDDDNDVDVDDNEKNTLRTKCLSVNCLKFLLNWLFREIYKLLFDFVAQLIKWKLLKK